MEKLLCRNPCVHHSFVTFQPPMWTIEREGFRNPGSPI
jgi:hypothetical protein